MRLKINIEICINEKISIIISINWLGDYTVWRIENKEDREEKKKEKDKKKIVKKF